jgi:hypothetical protein
VAPPIRRRLLPLTYNKLVKAHPEDATCAFCKKKNEHWDQDGFFYLWTRPGMAFEEGQAACKECVDGKPGQKHSEINGDGDEGR